jgi:hypothetical protein
MDCSADPFGINASSSFQLEDEKKCQLNSKIIDFFTKFFIDAVGLFPRQML